MTSECSVARLRAYVVPKCWPPAMRHNQSIACASFASGLLLKDILINPPRSDIATNRAINTDRRANPNVYMGSVFWTYPQDELITLRRAKVETERSVPAADGFDLASLDFRHAAEGDHPQWQPLRAFDDGTRVCSSFPKAAPKGNCRRHSYWATRLQLGRINCAH